MRSPLFASLRLAVLTVVALFVGASLASAALISPGENRDGTITTGDIDSWTFTAAANETLILRAGKLSGGTPSAQFNPYIRLYAPNGAQVAADWDLSDAEVTYRTTTAGTYTLSVTGYSGNSGTYRLRLLRIPGAFTVPLGDEGGALVNGQNHTGVIGIGDLDAWTISVAANDTLLLRAGATPASSTFHPLLRLYAPNGTLVGTNGDNETGEISIRATAPGTFTAVVSGYDGETGNYKLRALRIPGDFVVPADDQGGTLPNAQNRDGKIEAGDLDAWTVTAGPNDLMALRLVTLSSGQFTPSLRLYGPDGTFIAADSSSLSPRIDYRVPANGKYTIVVCGYFPADAGDYRLSVTGTTPPAPPVITTQPTSRNVTFGASTTFSVAATGVAPLSYQWKLDGAALAGATGSSFTRQSFQPLHAGIYTVEVTNSVGTTVSANAVAGLVSTAKVIGGATEFVADIVHANGNIYDQILLTGATATVTADPGQIARTSFVDLDDDIVQIEFSGAGSLTIYLAGATGPAVAAKYAQPGVQYIKGHPTLTLAGADETTHISIFTVGTATAVDQTLFKINETYDGVAGVSRIVVTSATGRLGSIRCANTEFYDLEGVVGLYAPGIRIGGPVNIHNLAAYDDAIPVLLTGVIDTGKINIAGGDMQQPNGRAVQIDGATNITMTAGATSHGVAQPAQTNKARYERNGVDVTSQVVTNP